MKRRFVFTVDVEGSLGDLETLYERLAIAISREVQFVKSFFPSIECKISTDKIESTERKQGIHPISPSVDYQNYPSETTE